VIIVGSGFSGATIAERCASSGKRVLVLEKRSHIGGNSYDYRDERGFLVHKYGPHIFHTSNREVWNYLSRFTRWREYHHRVMVYIDGKKVPLPFNLNSLKSLFPPSRATLLERKLIKNFGYGSQVSVLELKNSSDEDLRSLGDFIYRKIYLNYTIKQWGRKPEEISPQVLARVPVSISNQDEYFEDEFQGIPEEGYTAIFKKMLSHPNIKLLLNTDAKKLLTLNFKTGKIIFQGKEFNGPVVYTGPIDELFDYKHGELPYRTLRFQWEYHPVEKFQEVAVVNYPNDYPFTRITEYKHLTGETRPDTVIAKEFPVPYQKGKDIPYYPVLYQDSLERLKMYKRELRQFSNLFTLGRLGEFIYLNMDEAVERALMLFSKKLK